jgi:integrase
MRKLGQSGIVGAFDPAGIGSRLVMAGVDIRTVAELLGHKTLAMTMRYAHLAPDHQRAAVERLEATATKTATAPEPVVGYVQ